jgi:hypothetical protein
MPKVLDVGEYSIIIFTNDHPPPHVHARKTSMLAKIGLEPEVVLLSYDKKLSAADLRKVVQVVKDNHELLLTKWNELHPQDSSEE